MHDALAVGIPKWRNKISNLTSENYREKFISQFNQDSSVTFRIQNTNAQLRAELSKSLNWIILAAELQQMGKWCRKQQKWRYANVSMTQSSLFLTLQCTSVLQLRTSDSCQFYCKNVPLPLLLHIMIRWSRKYSSFCSQQLFFVQEKGTLHCFSGWWSKRDERSKLEVDPKFVKNRKELSYLNQFWWRAMTDSGLGRHDSIWSPDLPFWKTLQTSLSVDTHSPERN